MDQRRKRQFQITGGYWLLAIAALLLLQSAVLRQAAPKDVPYSEFLTSLRGGKVARAELRQDAILAELKTEGEAKPQRIRTSRLPGAESTFHSRGPRSSIIHMAASTTAGFWCRS